MKREIEMLKILVDRTLKRKISLNLGTLNQTLNLFDFPTPNLITFPRVGAEKK
jgi:hypothetical protein